MIYLFLLVPIMALYGMRDGPRSFVYTISLGFCIISLLQAGRFLRVRPLGVDVFLVILAVIGLITAYVYSGLLLTGGWQRINFDLVAIYDVREAYLEARFPLMGYVVPWQAHVINLAVLVFAVHFRWPVLGLASIAGQLALFAMTNFRTFLFAPIMVMLIYWLAHSKYRLHLFVLAAGGGSMATLVIYYASGDPFWPSTFIRRVFFEPALIHFYYHDWFSNNPQIHLSNSILSWFIEYPYDMRVTHVISHAYYGREGGPNVGIFGDAFAHFGYIGILMMSAALGLLLKVLDGCAHFLQAGWGLQSLRSRQ
jgi:hypothetical protein